MNAANLAPAICPPSSCKVVVMLPLYKKVIRQALPCTF